jgi:LPS export ABC transporter protein LptC
MVMTDIQLNIMMEGVRVGKLFADTAFMFQDSSMYHLRKPDLVMYTETGAEKARVTGLRGRFNPNTREMVAMGDVVLIINEGNKRVESQELNYDPNGDRISSDSLTTMIEPGRVSEGLGFQSDLNFRRTEVGPGSIRNTGAGSGGVEGGEAP